MSLFTKRRLVKFALISVLILLIAECGVRYYWYGANGFSPKKLNSYNTLRFSGLLQRAQNDSILWELKPNLNTLFKFEKFTTNSFGIRGREYSLKKPVNTKRIAVIGDSFAMGSGVSDTENYPALLETLLNGQDDGPKIEVLNFSVGSYGLHNYTAVLNEKVMPFDPDIVIIGFYGGNDFLLPKKEHLEGKYYFPPVADLFYHPYLYDIFSLSDRKNKLLTRNEIPLPSSNQKDFVKRYFEAISNRGKSEGIPVVMAYYAMLAKPNVIQSIADLATSSGMHFLNAAESLENIPLEKQFVHPLDGHPNAMVHKVYAQNILDFLTSKKLISK